jgi:hypothetical protein
VLLASICWFCFWFVCFCYCSTLVLYRIRQQITDCLVASSRLFVGIFSVCFACFVSVRSLMVSSLVTELDTLSIVSGSPRCLGTDISSRKTFPTHKLIGPCFWLVPTLPCLSNGYYGTVFPFHCLFHASAAII